MTDKELHAEIEKRVHNRAKQAALIQSDVTALALRLKAFADENLEIYNLLNDPDCLFNDSPLSHFNTYRWLKDWMIKKDMDFIGHALDGKASLKPFSDKMIEGHGWIMRFAKKKEKPKTGIEAIVKG